ncbi:N-acetyltransferase [Actinomadura fulvescens]|uniref:N-acetyltransferase n=1 Tax=Actinomadura fulvescens TaxID=46160 RepID=A0ABP6C391_9ACTN
MTGWKTRPETDQDVPAVRRVVEAAFPTSQEADLVDALRRDPAWLPGLSWVAEAPGGQVAAYALLTRCQVGDQDALALAPAAVLPEYQRQGAGGAAVRAALEAARDQGERLVVVLGHPEYYPKFGFGRASRMGTRTSFEVPDEALMALVLGGSGPVPTGTIRYAAPFGV